jgi:peptidoglycan-associated lipoprotein
MRFRIAILLLVLFSACSENTQIPPASVSPALSPVPVSPQDQPSSAVRSAAALSSSPIADPIIYFDFDRDVIRQDMDIVLHQFLPSLLLGFSSLVIEGHCDERGSDQYNIGLGTRRAQSTFHALILLGISSNKMSIMSYGKRRPLCMDHNEDCWRLNRRSTFIVRR